MPGPIGRSPCRACSRASRVGATILAHGAALAYLHGRPAAPIVAALLYPIGYVAAILGRAQLFTENTLYPVLATIVDRAQLRPTARLWVVVLAANVAGALLFALIVATTAALPPDVAHGIAALGAQASGQGGAETFWSAVLAGWLLALVAWVVEATDLAVSALLVVWVITMVVGLVGLDHSVATAVQVWTALLDGRTGLGDAARWWGLTVLGNGLGGVFIVSVLNYGQVRAGDERA